MPARINRRGIRLTGFWAPRYWPLWCLWLSLKLTSRLPLGFQHSLGRVIGKFLFLVSRRERRIALRNIEICFADLNASAQRKILREHFESLGMSFLEMGFAWFAPIEKLRRVIEVHGHEHLRDALEQNKPVLLWGAHFTCLELGVVLLEDYAPNCATMYRPQRNALLDRMIRWGRARFSAVQIPRDDVRLMLRKLKNKSVVVYFPDQTWLGNQSALLPFFGEPASTNIATSKLARMTGAIVLTYFYRRLPDGSGYRVDIGAPMHNFPGNDPIADSMRLFNELENYIRQAPEQYLWIYKKFKRRPAEFQDPYL